VLTGDQDWAPDWALSEMLAIAESEGVPFHLFVTNSSPSIAQTAAGVTLGLHPNFLPGSTHGASEDAVIDATLALVPDARSFRCHSFVESTQILRKLVARGLFADSNLLAFLQPGLTPIVHGAGLLRFPVFLEDDVFLQWAGSEISTRQLTRLLCTPGIKVLNFHPSLVALNAPSLAYYDAQRPALYGPGNVRAERFQGGGAQSVLRTVISEVRRAGFDFTSFPELVDAACGELPEDLYSWPGWRAGSTAL
jgi:hypothetical protein